MSDENTHTHTLTITDLPDLFAPPARREILALAQEAKTAAHEWADPDELPTDESFIRAALILARLVRHTPYERKGPEFNSRISAAMVLALVAGLCDPRWDESRAEILGISLAKSKV